MASEQSEWEKVSNGHNVISTVYMSDDAIHWCAYAYSFSTKLRYFCVYLPLFMSPFSIQEA